MTSPIITVWKRATYRGRPSFYDQFPLPGEWKPLLTRDGMPGRLWQWVVVDNRGRVKSGGTLVLDVEDVQEAAYEAMTQFRDERGLPDQELHGLWCAVRKSTDPDLIGVVDGRDW